MNATPLSLQARRRIERHQIRLEITALGREQLGQHLTARDLAHGALRRSLRDVSVEQLVAEHLGALASSGIQPRADAVVGMRCHLRRVLGRARARRRSNHPTTPEACR